MHLLRPKTDQVPQCLVRSPNCNSFSKRCCLQFACTSSEKIHGAYAGGMRSSRSRHEKSLQKKDATHQSPFESSCANLPFAIGSCVIQFEQKNKQIDFESAKIRNLKLSSREAFQKKTTDAPNTWSIMSTIAHNICFFLKAAPGKTMHRRPPGLGTLAWCSGTTEHTTSSKSDICTSLGLHP